MNILIAGAWPYANGSLHIGHIAALLPGDILARYFRLKGENVCYVSGSDCHGTPIQIRASKEGVSPNEIADKFHNEFKECFEKLGFSYDLYNKTSDEYHIDFVQGFFKRLLESGYIYKKTELQAYCSRCDQFLPDRFVVGVCPSCNSVARGDQCDICSDLLEPSTLKEPKCTICGETPEFKPSEHFYLSLSSFEEFIFDEKQPWLTVKSDISICKDTIYTCIQIIANLSVLLEPFLPFSSAEIHNMLKIKDIKWEFFEVDSNTEIENVKVLFERIEKSRIEEEVYRLKK